MLLASHNETLKHPSSVEALVIHQNLAALEDFLVSLLLRLKDLVYQQDSVYLEEVLMLPKTKVLLDASVILVK